MKILFLAPHPFYQDRGTPIDVHLVLSAMSERGDSVDLLTFHEGVNREYRNVKIYRINPWKWVKNIKPGFSWKKIICDFFMFIKLIRMLRQKKYDILHVTEESVFMALFISLFFHTPYIYDMDSLMSRQLVDKFRFLKVVDGLFRWCESRAIKKAIAVAPVCNALAEEAQVLGAKKIVLCKDVSLLGQFGDIEVENIRSQHSIVGPIIMYIGNFVYYQGVDLLIKSFTEVCKHRKCALVIIGGNPASRMEMYKEMALGLGCADNVYFLGQKRVEQLDNYMKQADILVSPRLHGHNTPMKIFSYLHSGIPVLATRLFTHTQEIPDKAALLASPQVNTFAEAIDRLLDDSDLRERLSKEAISFIEREHTYEALRTAIFSLYEDVERDIKGKDK
ncbi:glycosyltransferase [Candidatus Omnitrophota bacterium]